MPPYTLSTLRGSLLQVVIHLLCLHAPISATDLAHRSGMGRNTVSRALVYLCVQGWVVQYLDESWQLAQAARQQLMAWFGESPASSPAAPTASPARPQRTVPLYAPGADRRAPPATLAAPGASPGEVDASAAGAYAPPLDAHAPSIDAYASAEDAPAAVGAEGAPPSDVHAPPIDAYAPPGDAYAPPIDAAELKTLESLNTKKEDSLSTLSLRQVEAARQLLSLSAELFGEPILGVDPTAVGSEVILGWLAWAYDRRSSFRFPARVVQKCLKKRTPPPFRYASAPQRYLPESFWQALHLPGQEGDPPAVDPTPQAGGELAADPGSEPDPGPDPGAPPEADAAAELLEDPASLQLRRSPGAHHTVAEAFTAACQYYQTRFAYPIYHRYIEGLRPLRFDPEACTLFVAAERPEDLDYLRAHLAGGLQQCLKRPAGGEITLVFE